MSLIYAFSLGLLVVTACLALWRGGWPERATAVVLALNWVGTALSPFNHAEPPWIAIGLDCATMLFLLYLALFSGRRWTLWAAAFQFLLLCNHFAFIRLRTLEQWAYVSAYYVWGDAVVLALAVGALWRARRPSV